MIDVVEARFAGGPIYVDRDSFSGSGGVTVRMPGDTAGMWPGEARAFAAALLAAADAAEEAERSSLKRRRDVDEDLMSRDV